MGTRDYGTQYARLLDVEIRAAATTDTTSEAALLPLAKKRAIDPTVFDEVPPFFFGGVATNSNWDAYDTRMGMTSLQNYADDFTTGVSYLIGHNNRVIPIGGTLTGTFIQQSKAKALVRADVYMLENDSSLDTIQKIRAGIARDQSIGFDISEAQYICSICGRDMLNWWTDPNACQHILGMTYPQVDAKGKTKEDAPLVKARATIEGAHSVELSNVYEGATPGAIVDKVREFAAQGQLPPAAREFVNVRYKLDLPSGSRIFAVEKRGARTMLTEEQIAALQADLERTTAENARLREENTRIATQLEAANRVSTDTRSIIVGSLPADHPGQTDVVQGIRSLVEERTRLLPTVEDGRQYRVDLIAEALAAGVRAFGAEFQTDTYRSTLETSPLATIKLFRNDWTKTGDTKFPKGRQTSDEALEPVAQATETRHPAGVYRG